MCKTDEVTLITEFLDKVYNRLGQEEMVHLYGKEDGQDKWEKYVLDGMNIVTLWHSLTLFERYKLVKWVT